MVGTSVADDNIKTKTGKIILKYLLFYEPKYKHYI